MTELQQQLIDLYAVGPIDQVHAGADYAALCRAHDGDRVFHFERGKVEELRSQIDIWLRDQPTITKQIEYALRLLRKVKAREDNEKCLELILRSYARHWDELPRRYFEEHARRWIACRHYFLSFTNRNRSVVGQSQVNRNHEYFIVDVLTRPSFEQGDRLRRNLLAQAVHCLLQNEQLEGFYFPEHEGDNSVVEIKLRDNCERALAFVQLVQGEMFRHYEDKKNWCHFEYSVAQRVDSGRILFVQIDDEIPSDDISIEFEPWYRAFTRRDVPRLDWTRRADEPGVEANFKTIRRIAMDIRRIIDRVYVNIPH